MRFLNGVKTLLGLVGLVLVALSDTDVLPLLPRDLQPYITGAAALMTALGLVHKVEKAMGEPPPPPSCTCLPRDEAVG